MTDGSSQVITEDSPQVKAGDTENYDGIAGGDGVAARIVVCLWLERC
jgi:hypothetical protein